MGFLNLSSLNKDEILKDQEGRIFLITSLNNDKSNVKIVLSEITNNLSTWTCTLPMACNENKEFISPNDSDFKFKFIRLDKTKKDVCRFILDELILDEA